MKNLSVESLEIAKNEATKILERYQKKAEKERQKVDDVYILVCKEKCRSEEDILSLYEADCISCAQSDKYIEKLADKKKAYGENTGLTKSEGVCKILENFIYEIETEIEETANLED